MGKGTDLSREEAPEHAQLIDDLKDQLLIVLLNRLGGNADIPVSEIDNTGQFVVYLRLNENRVFEFRVEKKH